MRSHQVEHVLRAAADVLGQRDFIVIGSAAILASYPEEDLPWAATRSDEADLIPFDDLDGTKADRIEGAIGEISPIHSLHGYYAQGVSVQTALLPDGWRDRLVPFDAPGITPGLGHCLEPHDLAVAKLIAGRTKDCEFVQALIAMQGNWTSSSSALASTRCRATRCPARRSARRRAGSSDGRHEPCLGGRRSHRPGGQSARPRVDPAPAKPCRVSAG